MPAGACAALIIGLLLGAAQAAVDDRAPPRMSPHRAVLTTSFGEVHLAFFPSVRIVACRWTE
jgi:hypothetical protein